MKSLREQFFSGKGLEINPLEEAMSPEEKAKAAEDYWKRQEEKQKQKAAQKERMNKWFDRYNKFNDFLNKNLPELAQQKKDAELTASMYGETINAPDYPELTGDLAKDAEIAKEYMKQWFEAANKRERRPWGLGS